MGIDPLAIEGEQRQLLLNRLLLVEASLARVEQRFAQDSPLEGAGFELSIPRPWRAQLRVESLDIQGVGHGVRRRG